MRVSRKMDEGKAAGARKRPCFLGMANINHLDGKHIYDIMKRKTVRQSGGFFL